MTPAPLSKRCFFAVEAAPDSALVVRILQILTPAGDVPEWFSVRRDRPTSLRITVELSGVSEDAMQVLALNIRHLPGVLDVSRSWLSQSEALKP